MENKACTVNVEWEGKRIQYEFKKGENVLDILRREPSLPLSFPCGGKKSCGKCIIIVTEGDFPPPDESEFKMLPGNSEGERLACHLTADSSFSVKLKQSEDKAVIKHSGHGHARQVGQPMFKRISVSLPPADSSSDHQRLSSVIPHDYSLNLRQMALLPLASGPGAQDLTVSIYDENIVSLDNSGHNNDMYGAALDIGTTTMVLYLVNLEKYEIEGTVSLINPQRKYGHDVIARLEFAREGKAQLDQISMTVRSAINELIDALCEKNTIIKDRILSLSVSGNTAMIHLLAGFNPEKLCQSPFSPVTLAALNARAGELNLNLHEDCPVYILPGLSSYVGGDITAGIIATEFYTLSKNILLVDIGTNGEIVLSAGGDLFCCSTAAGPAFEGANIKAGMAAVRGAVSHMRLSGSHFVLDIIDNAPAAGLCGSGLIDFMRILVDSGLVDETGRIVDRDEVNEEFFDLYDNSVKSDDDGLVIYVAPAADKVFLTQKDVREIQLAKAAISGGIMTLLRHNELNTDDVDSVYLAGGFGSFIDLENALRIGLLPSALKGKIISAGNTAGMGAIACLLDKKARDEASRVAEMVKELDLSTHPVFQEEYVNNMFF